MKTTPLRAFSALKYSLAGATALLSVGCDSPKNKAAWWQGEQERIQLSQDFALKQLRVEKATNSGLAELEKLRSVSTDAEIKLLSLRGQTADLRDEVAELESDLPAFREAVLNDRRQKAVGEKYASFETPSGKSFKEVSVVSVSDIGVAIRHSDGSARLAFDDLTADQRNHFGIDAERALTARKEEQRAVAQYERYLDTQIASMQEEKRQQTVLASAKASEERAERTLASARQLVSSSNRALSQPSRSFGRYYSYRGYRRYYSPTYYTRTYYVSPYCYSRYNRSISNLTGNNRVQRYDRYNYAQQRQKTRSSVDSLITK